MKKRKVKPQAWRIDVPDPVWSAMNDNERGFRRSLVYMAISEVSTLHRTIDDEVDAALAQDLFH